jgi:hypothetical protein
MKGGDMMNVNQRVLMIKNGVVIAEFKSINEAKKETKVPYGTIYYQCKFNTKGNTDTYFKFADSSLAVKRKKHPRKEEIVQLNMDNEYIATFKNQSEAAIATGISVTTINRNLRGLRNTTKFKFMYKSNYENLYGKIEDKPKEINETFVRPKTKEYYVNILVGLANGTLIDRAIYDLNGTLMSYSKKDNALMVGDNKVYTQQDMYKECSIELPLLLPQEREFLSNLLKAFTNVKGIRKCDDKVKGFEFIRIETSNSEDTIALPSFVEGKYYGGLQKDALYTVESLLLGD